MMRSDRRRLRWSARGNQRKHRGGDACDTIIRTTVTRQHVQLSGNQKSVTLLRAVTQWQSSLETPSVDC